MRVRFRGEILHLEASSLSSLQDELAARTSVPVEHQKIVGRSGRLHSEEQFVQLAADSEILQLFGSTAQDLEAMHETKDAAIASEARSVWNDLDVDYEALQLEREHKAAVREKAARQLAAEKTEWHFHSYRALPQFRDAQRAMEILQRLGTDPGFVAVMQKHKWKVGVLSEMYPDGKVGVDPVCVLGVNINKGQEISLRLRTDDLQGFRKYDEIRKVLCHELSHMVHSEHDKDFYQLMRQIEKEQVNLDWRNSGGHTLGGGHYMNAGVVARPPREAASAPAGGTYRLGGDTPGQNGGAESATGVRHSPRLTAALAAERRAGQTNELGASCNSSVVKMTLDVNSKISKTRQADIVTATKESGANARLSPSLNGDSAADPTSSEKPATSKTITSSSDLIFSCNDANNTIDERTQREVQNAVSQVIERNEPDRALRALQLLGKVLRNVLRDPSNVKFQRLGLTNPKFREAIGSVLGAQNVLTTVGWNVIIDEQGQGTLVFLNTVPTLARCAFALKQVEELQDFVSGISS